MIEEGEKQGKGKDIADFEDPVYKAHKEVKEMKEILPDIVTKVSLRTPLCVRLYVAGQVM